MSSLRDDLVALAGLLNESLQAADVDKRAALAREYRATITQLADLPAAGAGKEATGLDEFNAFKQQRTAKSPGRTGKASG